MGPAPLAALGATAVAFAAILVRLADVPPSTAAALRFAYALPVLALLAGWEGQLRGRRRRRERQLALVGGALLGLELVVWHHSIANVGAGLATALFANLQIVFVAVVAWAVLGERPSRRLLVALPVVLAGTLLVSGALEQDAYGRDPALGAIFGVLAGITYGAFFLVFRRTGHAGAVAGPLLDVSLAGAVTAAVAGLALGELDLSAGWAAHGWLALLALSAQVLGFILIGSALPRLPAAVGSMLLMLQPVIAVGFGVLLLAEEPTTLQLAGVILLLTGVLTASTGRGGQGSRSTPGPLACPPPPRPRGSLMDPPAARQRPIVERVSGGGGDSREGPGGLAFADLTLPTAQPPPGGHLRAAGHDPRFEPVTGRARRSPPSYPLSLAESCSTLIGSDVYFVVGASLSDSGSPMKGSGGVPSLASSLLGLFDPCAPLPSTGSDAPGAASLCSPCTACRSP